MGRSAKLHKRGPKSAHTTAAKPRTNADREAAAAAAAADPKNKQQQRDGQSVSSMKDRQRKARAALEDLRHGKEGPVLAGVDYLALAHGGRRKATAEASKMLRLRAEGEMLYNVDAVADMKLQ
ncbi:hypothetical protein BKA62DRAFT_833175 [Auriculariales sp. MPI-PUGE-AT-0066]|nr:hypothetical protein BKA62DRAFT_836079 [Auriculariales sp. MPI-PUGE-AT-0066]KAH7097569.1 hypothetical protein BKA62DRAFT_833175 [Auriculariales sp. MPI-PUGE-AT-0066]